MADKQPPRTKKYYRSTKSGAGMTRAGVKKYRRDNPGSKLKTAVTGKVKKIVQQLKEENHIVLEVQGRWSSFLRQRRTLTQDWDKQEGDKNVNYKQNKKPI